jgi:DNA-binding response OmpR family regulator
MRILIVEDDRDVAEYLGRCLEEEGHGVTVCFDGGTGLRTAQSSGFDVIVLDVMLPFMNGFDVARTLRADNIATPILLLTGRDSTSDIVRGLDSGADDYLTKPFSFEVLLARLRARTRPSRSAVPSRLRYADLIIDLETHEVSRAAVHLALTRTEFALLECLMRAAGKVVTRQSLIDQVWGIERDVGDNNLDVFIRLLRTKVDGLGQPRLIQTVRGVGYCLRDEPQA